MSSVKIFKSRKAMQLEQYFSQYYRCFKKVNPASPDYQDAVQEVDEEMQWLEQDILNFNSLKLKKVKRMGLSRIRKTFLEQTYFYLTGVLKVTKFDTLGSLKAAVSCLLKSVTIGSHQVNAQAKKSLMQMHHILLNINARQKAKEASLRKVIEHEKRREARE